MVNPIMMMVVAHAIKLNHVPFTYLPISSLLLISSNMKINTKGRTIPFTTWERTMIFTSGMLGSKMTPPPAMSSRV